MNRIAFGFCIFSFLLLFTVITANAEPLELLIYRGNQNYSRKNYEEALKYYTMAESKSDKTYRALYNKGNALFKLENYREAEKAYIEALMSKKDRIKKDAYFNLGNTYFILGEYRKAVDSYIKSLEIDPYDMDTKYNLELAWKKLEEQQKRQSAQISDEKQKENKLNDTGKDSNKEKQEGSQKKETGTNEIEKLTPQEAKNIINSIQNNQDEILRNTILKKANIEDEEKDW